MEEILTFLKEPFCSPIKPDDYKLFRSYFATESTIISNCYGNSWLYLTQAAHGEEFGHELGYKYVSSQFLAVIGFFKRPYSSPPSYHFHIIRPMGVWWEESFTQLCRRLWEISGQPVYIKKLSSEQYAHFLQKPHFHGVEKYPWHPLAPAEDDTYPEVLVDIKQTLEDLVGGGKHELKTKYKRFLDRFKMSLQDHDYNFLLASQARQIVESFFEYEKHSQTHLSSANDYYNMLMEFGWQEQFRNDFWKGVISINSIPAAFYAAERLGSGTGTGLYANLTLYREYPYISEYLLLHLMEKLDNQNISVLNLGGSETAGLHSFKSKFKRHFTRQMHWTVYSEG